jgi:hypothetical protein
MSQFDQDLDLPRDYVPPEVLRTVETVSIRDQVLDLLLEKVENDRYPSVSMMDAIERLLTPGRKAAYAEVLMAKIRDDRFPSRTMIERLMRLSSR